MNDYLIYSIGFFAQLLFGLRMVIQWIQSEKAKRVVAPTLFWQTSLFASALFLVYGLLRQDGVIIFGQLLAYFIYIRNLQINGEWKKLFSFARFTFLILPFFVLVLLWRMQHLTVEYILGDNLIHNPLFIAGTIGQLLLNVRFVYQWYFAEKTGDTNLPLGFWVISSFGSVLVIAYAIFRSDPVLLLAQSLGMLVYSRNIILYKRAQSNIHAS